MSRNQTTIGFTPKRANVAVPPRSPIGYNPHLIEARHAPVAVPPRSPIGYNRPRIHERRGRVAVPPRSPIGSRITSCRSPIGYNKRPSHTLRRQVAVPPRSPIGYNRIGAYSPSVQELRFLPDLPSATIHRLPDDTWLKAGLAGQKPQKSGVNGLRTVCTVLDFCWPAAA